MNWLYHVTNTERAAEIARSGLRTHKPWDFTDQDAWPDGSTQKRSYFSERPLLDFAPEEGEPVVLRVPTGVAEFKRERYTGDWYTTKVIPPTVIEIERAGRWLPLVAARRSNPAPALPGTAGWDPSWVIGVDDSSPNTRTIHILEGDREIGELTLTPSVHVPGAWRIAHALVRRGAERRGLGQAMYLVALRLLGRVHPDWEHSVSPSALRVWQALIRRDLVTGTRPKVFRPLRVVRNAESRGHWDLVFPGDWLGYSQGGATVVLFPDGWRGVLDQVYTLRDPSSVPLVKAR